MGRFHKALTAVCSFFLLPRHQGPAAEELKQGSISKGQGPLLRSALALGRSGRNGLSLHTSALFTGS